MTIDLSRISDEDINREYWRRIEARRQAGAPLASGRPKKLRRCPSCGQMFGGAELRKHQPTCAHRHQAKPKLARESAWSHCVTPDLCAAHPDRQSAHGNITRIDVCSCGAERVSEININRTNYGAWEALSK